MTARQDFDAKKGTRRKARLFCFGNTFRDVSPDIAQAIMSQAALSPPSRSVTAALMRSMNDTG